MAQFVFVDLRSQERRNRCALLKRFYDEFMLVYFPCEDERDPLEVWEAALSCDQQKKRVQFHIILAFSKNDVDRKHILGGTVAEYYPASNCGLLSFVVVAPKQRQNNLAKLLVEEGYQSVNRDAQTLQNLPGCYAYLAETHSPELVDVTADTMDPSVRLKVLQKLGFYRVLFDYVQPPLSKFQQPCTTLLLAVYLTPDFPRLNPSNSSPSEPLSFLDSDILRQFIIEFWHTTIEQPQEYPHYNTALEKLSENKQLLISYLSQPIKSSP